MSAFTTAWMNSLPSKTLRLRLIEREAQLFSTADLVFTGGESLYQAKRNQHPRVYAFPSSIDASHFNKARGELQDPTDQKDIPRPRIGFFGVIDERMDLTLVSENCEPDAGMPVRYAWARSQD